MDFSSISSMSGSMRRKQSNAFLQALSKPRQPISSAPAPAPTSTYNVPPTASTSHFPLDELHSPELDAMSMSSRSTSLGTHTAYSTSHASHVMASGGGRSSSATLSTHSSSLSKDKREKERVAFATREEAFALFLGRIKRWNFMRRWYQGEVLWCESVLIPRPYLEASLGAKHIETRARSFYMLGISLSALFDLTQANEFLKALNRLLDEWEAWTEGSSVGKGVKNLFRGPRSTRRVTGGGSIMPDFSPSGDPTESLLMVMNIPFTPDFYEVHASLCSIILDIYRKLMGNLQPLSSSLSPSSYSRSFHTPSATTATGTTGPSVSSLTYADLHHPSVILRSIPLPTPTTTPTPSEASNPRSPGVSSLATATLSSQHGHSHPGYGVMSPRSIRPGTEDVDDDDPLKPYIMGEHPTDRVIVGDGQAMGDIAKLYSEVDLKLKKIISSLTREADAVAKRVVDDQLAALRRSMDPGGKAIRYDLNGGVGALSLGAGRARQAGQAGPGQAAATVGRTMLVGGENGGRDFGTI